MKHEFDKREIAIRWWDLLTEDKKEYLIGCMATKISYFGGRKPHSLTGREIELIYNESKTRKKFVDDEDIKFADIFFKEDMLDFGKFCFIQAHSINDNAQTFEELFEKWLTFK